MGNRQSHDESDGEDRGHSGTFRDFLKNKSPISPSGKRVNKEDVVDGPRQISNNTPITNDAANKPSTNTSSDSSVSSSSKPDGITKLAKVSCMQQYFSIALLITSSHRSSLFDLSFKTQRMGYQSLLFLYGV